MLFRSSLAVGTEVVAADIPVFREVGGKEVKFFDPSSAEDLANVLAQNLDSEITSSQIIKRITYAKAFSWSAVASQVAHHYRELLCQQ